MNTERDKAVAIVSRVAEQRKRWGKHSGFAEYTEDDVLDALLFIHGAGLLDFEGDYAQAKEDMTASNRAKGAAEARAKKYKGQLDALQEQLGVMVIALEDAEGEISDLKAELATAQEERDIYHEELLSEA